MSRTDLHPATVDGSAHRQASQCGYVAVHGIGPFSGDDLIRNQLTALFHVTPSSVRVFNWDRAVDRPRPTHETLKELASSVLTAADLGLRGGRRTYVGLSARRRQLVNDVLMIFRVAWLIGAPIGLYSCLNRDTRPFHAWIVTVGALLIAISLVILSALNGGAIRVATRSVALTVVWPLCHLLAAIAAYPAIPAAILVTVLLIVALPFSGHLAAMIVAILAAAVVLALSVYVLAPLPPLLLKLLADIVRYLADSDYRNRLQQALQNTLEEALASSQHGLVVLCHSLGSVIAVDTLVRMGQTGTKPRVLLITMGSPIRSLFSRFFPEIYPSVCELSEYFCFRFTNFAWVNVFRRFDYVGRRLAHTNDSRILDINTGQLWPMHIGYWSDPKVLDRVKEAVGVWLEPVSGRKSTPRLWPDDLCGVCYKGLSKYIWEHRAAWAHGLLAVAVAPLVLATIQGLHWYRIAAKQGITSAHVNLSAVGLVIELLVVAALFPTVLRYVASVFGSGSTRVTDAWAKPAMGLVIVLLMSVGVRQCRMDSRELRPLGNPFDASNGSAEALAFDGERVAVLIDGIIGNEISVIDICAGKTAEPFLLEGYRAVRVKPDMSAFAFVTKTGATVEQIRPVRSALSYAWNNPQGVQAISADLGVMAQLSDDAILLRDITTGALVTQLPIKDVEHHQPPRLRFVHNHLIALFDDMAAVSIYRSPAWTRTLISGVRTISSIPFGPERFDLKTPWALSPDGRRLVAEQTSGEIAIWGPDGALLRKTWLEGKLEAAAFSDDGKYWASYSAPGILRVWASDNDREVGRYLQFDLHPVKQLMLSRDGLTVLSVSLRDPASRGDLELRGLPRFQAWRRAH